MRFRRLLKVCVAATCSFSCHSRSKMYKMRCECVTCFCWRHDFKGYRIYNSLTILVSTNSWVAVNVLADWCLSLCSPSSTVLSWTSISWAAGSCGCFELSCCDVEETLARFILFNCLARFFAFSVLLFCKTSCKIFKSSDVIPPSFQEALSTCVEGHPSKTMKTNKNS